MDRENLIKKYTDQGVMSSKIHVTASPSVCIWSKTRKCLVGNRGEPDIHEVIRIEPDGVIIDECDFRISTENNVIIPLMVHEEIDSHQINQSPGIVITGATYGKPHFRFGWIPKN